MPASRKTIHNCAPPAGEGERTVTVTAAPAGSASETTGSVISRSESLSASVAWVPYKDVTISGGVSNIANTVVHETARHGLGKLADEYAYLTQGEVTA